MIGPVYTLMQGSQEEIDAPKRLVPTLDVQQDYP